MRKRGNQHEVKVVLVKDYLDFMCPNFHQHLSAKLIVPFNLSLFMTNTKQLLCSVN